MSELSRKVVMVRKRRVGRTYDMKLVNILLGDLQRYAFVDSEYQGLFKAADKGGSVVEKALLCVFRELGDL